MQRVVAQIVLSATSILTKAFMQAYQQAKAGGGTVRSATALVNRMDASQARSILNIESKTPAKAEIQKQFERYYSCNDPDKGGSFYIQSKVFNAREVLLQELQAAAIKPAAKAPLR